MAPADYPGRPRVPARPALAPCDSVAGHRGSSRHAMRGKGLDRAQEERVQPVPSTQLSAVSTTGSGDNRAGSRTDMFGGIGTVVRSKAKAREGRI